MQRFELLALFVIVVVLSSAAGLAIVRHRADRRWFAAHGLGVGVAAGVVGALIVLVPRTDLIPDGIDSVLQPIFIVLVTLAAVAGSWYRLASR